MTHPHRSQAAVEPWAADVEIDAAVASRSIARQFPELAGLEVEPYGEGWDNAAYLIGGKYVFRFPRRAIAVDLIETEIRVLPAIAARVPLAIPIPRFMGDPAYDVNTAGGLDAYEHLLVHDALIDQFGSDDTGAYLQIPGITGLSNGQVTQVETGVSVSAKDVYCIKKSGWNLQAIESSSENAEQLSIS